jgi:hypothetical protein
VSPARRSALAVALAAALAAACTPSPTPDPGPLDRFAFPISGAVVGDTMYVVSSNFDLTYGYDDGGTVIPVALPPASQPAARPTGTLRAGGVRIPSLGGDVVVADAKTCGLPNSIAVVPVRATNAVMLVDILADGTLSCGDRCRVSLPTDHADPYGAAVVCQPDGHGGVTARAYAGFLRGPTSSGAISQIDLADTATTTRGTVVTIATGLGAPRSFAYDALTGRLFFSNIDAVVAAPITWLELAGGCSAELPEIQGGCPLRSFDLWPLVRGFEPHGIALSNDQPGLARRLNVVGRLFDADVAAAASGRPSYDVGSALLVLELSPSSAGGLDFRLVDSFPLGMGASELQVLPPRPADGTRPRRDVVAITATGDGLLWLYDDDLGAMVKVFGRNEGIAQTPAGLPALGRQPYGLMVRPLGASAARLFVTSFGQHFLDTLDVPLADPASTSVLPDGSIGGAQ